MQQVERVGAVVDKVDAVGREDEAEEATGARGEGRRQGVVDELEVNLLAAWADFDELAVISVGHDDVAVGRNDGTERGVEEAVGRDVRAGERGRRAGEGVNNGKDAVVERVCDKEGAAFESEASGADDQGRGVAAAANPGGDQDLLDDLRVRGHRVVGARLVRQDGVRDQEGDADDGAMVDNRVVAAGNVVVEDVGDEEERGLAEILDGGIPRAVDQAVRDRGGGVHVAEGVQDDDAAAAHGR